MNHVILVGTVSGEMVVNQVSGGVRHSVFHVDTGGVSHKVKVTDEFLAQSLFGSLADGAPVTVIGELAYDSEGAWIMVPPRRNCDVQVSPTTGRMPDVRQEAPARPAQEERVVQTQQSSERSVPSQRPPVRPQPVVARVADSPPQVSPKPEGAAPVRAFSSMRSVRSVDSPSVDETQSETGDTRPQQQPQVRQTFQPRTPTAFQPRQPAQEGKVVSDDDIPF